MISVLPNIAIPNTSDYLREVSAPSITVDKCAAHFGSIISQKQICIDTTGGHSACNVSGLNYQVENNT